MLIFKDGSDVVVWNEPQLQKIQTVRAFKVINGFHEGVMHIGHPIAYFHSVLSIRVVLRTKITSAIGFVLSKVFNDSSNKLHMENSYNFDIFVYIQNNFRDCYNQSHDI